ncbi:MAG: Na/Pi cotransporter family protein [Clostridiales bacterium]|nr:Na/Pi cotransporter family protein [Clostridiales bacterium]
MEGTFSIVALLGGLGLFLYGMNMMGDGLELVAGSKLRKLLSALTTNRYLGALVGIIVTAIIQSSSATTVMVVGFVNAGLMNLFQAVGVIMGANIGTTVTGLIIALKITDIAGIALFAGVVLMTFFKKASMKHTGQVIAGFGILFIGLNTMSGAMEPLKTMPEFTGFLTMFQDNPLLAILIGAVFTAVIQSSSASIGILQGLAMQGIIGIEGSVYILLGMNIGTCVTALLAAVGANKNAHRAAVIHLLFNIIGAVMFGVILWILPFTDWMKLLSPDPVAQIAYANLIFKTVTTILLLPMGNLMVKMSYLIVRGEEKRDGAYEPQHLKYLDERILRTPPIAVEQVIRETERMAVISRQNFHDAMEAFFDGKKELVEKVFANEKALNFMNREITKYLVRISAMELQESDSRVIGSLYHVVSDFERIGDHSENIVEFAQSVLDGHYSFSQDAIGELQELTLRVEVLLDEALHMFRTRVYDEELAATISEGEEAIDDRTELYRNNHVDRLAQGLCAPEQGMLFVDLLANLERVADHATNIAFSLKNAK